MGKLSGFETLTMIGPGRSWWVKKVDAAILFKGLPAGKFPRILEIGCGAGGTTMAILECLKPAEVVATDYDPDMVRRAESHVLKRWRRGGVTFRQADVTQLPFESESFDAVVSFCVLHHVEDFPHAIREIHRVLKPGGTFLIEEVTKELHFWPIDKLMPAEAYVTKDDVRDAMEQAGFNVTWRGSYWRGYIFFEGKKAR